MPAPGGLGSTVPQGFPGGERPAGRQLPVKINKLSLPARSKTGRKWAAPAPPSISLPGMKPAAPGKPFGKGAHRRQANVWRPGPRKCARGPTPSGPGVSTLWTGRLRASSWREAQPGKFTRRQKTWWHRLSSLCKKTLLLGAFQFLAFAKSLFRWRPYSHPPLEKRGEL